ncbi:DUF2490 domain-containing protein [Gaetbulibacter aestuarii]|uniref:DUF2490 domain-containing protein n=1 Tax=Gaetbulibacter aestuarii TaxID=1502358 RepID=A0ABW7MWI9_9FLAO
MKKSLGIVFCLLFGLLSRAQVRETETTMLWTLLGVNADLNDKFDLSYYQLHSFSFNSSSLNFIQPDLELGYDLAPDWDVKLGYSPTFSLDGVAGNQLVYHRISARVRLSSHLGRRFRMKNALVAEQHFTQRSKFKQRYYYRLDLYYRDTDLPWRLRPFVNQRFYYYANGQKLQYFNTDGEPTAYESPNGFHAYRLQIGVKVYPIDHFNFSIFYLKQKEFNSRLFNSRDINTIDPNTNTVSRKFYDFTTIGLSCSYNL